MIWRAVLIAVSLALAACAQDDAPPPTVSAEQIVPTELRHCPQGVPAPKPPPSPRTVKQLAAWGVSADAARARTEQARRVCADHLKRLIEWVENRSR